jgi:hypothetical protein
MPPTLAIDDQSNGFTTDPELSGQSWTASHVCGVQTPDLAHLIIRQFRKAVPLALDDLRMLCGRVLITSQETLRLSSSPMLVPLRVAFWVSSWARTLASGAASLRPHVKAVVGLRSEEEVIWPNARAVVALVTDAHTIGDLPKVQSPRVDVCPYVMMTGREAAVAVTSAAGPNPTRPQFLADNRAVFVDLRPEAVYFRNAGWLSQSSASLRAAAAYLVGIPAVERLPAVRTDPGVPVNLFLHVDLHSRCATPSVAPTTRGLCYA